MAGPGDPTRPDDHDDDLIGFASPASLQGRGRDSASEEPEPETAPVPPAVEPDPDLFSPRPETVAAAPVEPEPTPEPVSEPEPKQGAPRWAEPVRPSVQPAPAATEAVASDPVPEPDAAPRPVDAAGIFEPSQGFAERRRRPRPTPLPGGGMSLYAVYALILFAVPTMGVSALVGLLAVTGRDGPEDDLSRSHFIYQQRTLWATAIAAGAGLILLAAPLALGVPILFALALWLVARGALGVWALKAGRPIDDPRGWWVDLRRLR